MPLPHVEWKNRVIIKQLKDYFKTHSEIREYQAHSAKVHSVSWNADGNYLASGSFDKLVAIFALNQDKLSKITVLRGHTGSVDQLCWHPSNPDLLCTASGDKTVRIWDARCHKSVAVINTQGENINICWAPNGQTIGVGNKEDLIAFIDVNTFKIILEHQFPNEINEISWNNTSDLFFLTNGNGCVQILSYPQLETQHTVRGHAGACVCIDFDPTGKYFATGSADALVSLWDLEDLACIRTYSRLDWPVRAVSFSHDGYMLASASEDLFIDVAEVESGAKIIDIPIDAATFTCAWHPKQYLLAYACDDKDTYDRKKESGNLRVFGFSQ